MQNLQACKFSHKNEILSRIEEILFWTKNTNNTWNDNLFATAASTLVLLKLGHTATDLNIIWIEKMINDLEKTKNHLTDSTLFCGFCLGLLSLSINKKITKKQMAERAEALAQELPKLNWMNAPKTVAFLALILRENELIKNYSGSKLFQEFEKYLISSIHDDTLTNENLSYALFALSILNPDITKDYILRNPEAVKKLANHPRIEIRALSLNILDQLEIVCAETTYQGIWDYFDEKRYGVIERSIIQKLTSAVYHKFTGAQWDTKDVRIFENEDLARVEIDVTKAGLESMVRNTPPIDQLSIVALSILCSNYDKIYTYSRRKNDDYERLTHLDNKEKYMPLEKTAAASISRELFTYKRGKMLLKYGIISAAAFLSFPILLLYLSKYLLPSLPQPYSEVAGTIIGAALGFTAFFQWILGRARQDYAKIKDEIKSLRNEGKW
jgi:hypothetical protein